MSVFDRLALAIVERNRTPFADAAGFQAAQEKVQRLAELAQLEKGE